jgi:hypothetical protein
VWSKQADLDEGRRDDGLTTSEREELGQLRRKLGVLEEEREILKQAAASSLGRPITPDEVPADRSGEGPPRWLSAVPRAGCVARGLLRLEVPAAVGPDIADQA